MSRLTPARSNPVAFMLMILGIAALLAVTGCSSSPVGHAADPVDRLGDLFHSAQTAADTQPAG